MNFNFQPSEERQNPLRDFGRNLTDLAAKNELDPVIGRDDEIRRIIRILSRKTKNNPILVGEPGVGKTAIVEGLARKIVAGDVPEHLKDKEIIEIEISSIIAGASFQGQFEKRLKDIIKQIEQSNGQIILFIDEVHTLIGTGRNADGSLDAAQMLKPLLARGKIRLIGATTYDEYRKYIEKDLAFERRMQKVPINEPTIEEAITILRGLKEKLETFHRVKISDHALVEAVKLSSRYIPERFLPDKAIDLIDEAAAGIQTELHSKPEALEKAEQRMAMLKMEEVAISKEKDTQSRMRLQEVKLEIEKVNQELSNLNQKWKSEKELAKNISELKTKIDSYRAMQNRYQVEGEYEKASILLYKEIPELEKKLTQIEADAKTKSSNLVKENVTVQEIANVVSKWTQIPINKLVQSEKDKLLSLEKHLATKIKGQNNALKLIVQTILRAKADINDPNRPLGSFIFMGPTGVGKTEVAKVLASELFSSEKHLIRVDMSEYMEAHDVSRLIGTSPGYIGYEEGGHLTETIREKPYAIVLLDEIEKAHPKILDILLQILDEGEVTDGRGKAINFRNTIIILTTNLGALDVLENKKDEDVKKRLAKHLRPEFINRIDEIIVFKSLTPDVFEEITKLELENLQKRLQERSYYVDFEENLLKTVAAKSFDYQFGARPIRRFIKNEIESPLALEIISNNISTETNYILDFDKNGKLTYKKRQLS